MSEFRRKDGNVEAPINLVGFFTQEASDDSDCESSKNEFQEIYEVQTLKFGSEDCKDSQLELDIRQYSWHQTNANKVNPCIMNEILRKG